MHMDGYSLWARAELDDNNFSLSLLIMGGPISAELMREYAPSIFKFM